MCRELAVTKAKRVARENPARGFVLNAMVVSRVTRGVEKAQRAAREVEDMTIAGCDYACFRNRLQLTVITIHDRLPVHGGRHGTSSERSLHVEPGRAQPELDAAPCRAALT